jgi:outer membrane biogenesis lipoprotein LolB
LRKIIFIAILGVILYGCSATKKAEQTSEISLTGNILEDTKNQNLTNENFFVQKGEVEYINGTIKEKFLFTLKYEKPGKYLISLKNRTGIEGARAYISGDTILVNDRINKILYSASSLYLQKNFGFNQTLLPLIFGDIVYDKDCGGRLEKCTGSKLNLDCQVKGTILNYVIDCSKRKISESRQRNNFREAVNEVRYEQFTKSGSIITPKNIEVHQKQTNTIIKIKILKILIPWQGNIEFVPGRDYEKMELI